MDDLLINPYLRSKLNENISYKREHTDALKRFLKQGTAFINHVLVKVRRNIKTTSFHIGLNLLQFKFHVADFHI